MRALLSDPASWLFIYLLAGGIVFMVSDPAGRVDYAIGAHTRREGRLPSAGVVIIACAISVLLWPWTVAQALGLSR